MKTKSYLKDLILLRNDPSKIPEMREDAQAGDRDAQYALGLVYAEGRGIPEDPAQALYWLSLAVEQGDKDADLLRKILLSRMTNDEIDAAQRLRSRPRLRLIDS
jgi:TPR repeat protein